MNIKDSWFFLATGGLLILLGYSMFLRGPENILDSPNWRWWAFGVTLLGGLILGKAIADTTREKKKK